MIFLLEQSEIIIRVYVIFFWGFIRNLVLITKLWNDEQRSVSPTDLKQRYGSMNNNIYIAADITLWTLTMLRMRAIALFAHNTTNHDDWGLRGHFKLFGERYARPDVIVLWSHTEIPREPQHQIWMRSNPRFIRYRAHELFGRPFFLNIVRQPTSLACASYTPWSRKFPTVFMLELERNFLFLWDRVHGLRHALSWKHIAQSVGSLHTIFNKA